MLGLEWEVLDKAIDFEVIRSPDQWDLSEVCQDLILLHGDAQEFGECRVQVECPLSSTSIAVEVDVMAPVHKEDHDSPHFQALEAQPQEETTVRHHPVCLSVPLENRLKVED